jgi:hypothetical protein
MKSMLPMAVIIFAGVTLFGAVTASYFCGYDDFADVHRAAFEDTREPSRIFTTTHFGTPKYRPLQRGFTFVCWMLGSGSALPYRIRNLFFHLMAALLIYGIAVLATGDGSIAFGAGLLFAIHPLADQSTVAASWTNTTAYALMLASFYLFQRSLHRNRPGLLAGAFLTLFIALFFYEAVIVAVGMMILYLLVWRARTQPVPPKVLAAFGSGCALVLLAFATVRHIVVSQPTPLVPLGQIARNVAMYAAALISPVDSVLANSVFGTPLPPDIHGSKETVAIIGACGVGLALLAFLVLRTSAMRARLARLDWWLAGFLVFSIAGALAPFLVFTPHASETYLYLPTALFSILLCVILRALLSSRGYAVAVTAVALLFGAATWERNHRVSTCGAIAKNIITQLPVAQWRQGDWEIRLQSEPSATRRYGIYGYDGLSTIDVGDPGIPAAQMVVQILTGNERIHVGLVPPGPLDRECPLTEQCFSISREGDVQRIASR